MEYLLVKMAKYFFDVKEEAQAEELLIGNDENGNVETLLSDIEKESYAFIIPFIVDENQIDGKPEKLPYEIKKIYNSLDTNTLENITLMDWKNILENNGLTNNVDEHAKNLLDFVSLIKNKYDGDVKNIWNDNPTSLVLKTRLIEISGINEEKANMIAYILVTKFKVKLSSYENIDINNDFNISLTMRTLGLVNSSSYEEQKAVCRKIFPQFPGIFDSFFWMIGEYIVKSRIDSSLKMEDDFGLLKDCEEAVQELKEHSII